YTMPAEDVTLTAKFQEKVSVSNPETLTISMYPNPSRGNVIITSDYIIIEISVYDMTGKLVKKVNTEAEQVDLQLSAIEPGLYFVKIITSAGEKMMKLQVL
ncbi:MAG: T9SS type A sorting domain-containing protein, partial [Bacteroidetes bacterium]|nr:T9SS type A sorting domain-containing protein [Bacteroidota bacterium]